MTYRIRYRKAGETSEAETLIEAISPAEALVKFRCTLEPHSVSSPKSSQITSVHPVRQPD